MSTILTANRHFGLMHFGLIHETNDMENVISVTSSEQFHTTVFSCFVTYFCHILIKPMFRDRISYSKYSDIAPTSATILINQG